MSTNGRLSEQEVILAFHAYLKNSLAQAKAERLLDDETLSSAEADIMVAGPALCLYFAAIRTTASPPGVSLPRSATGEPVVLNSQTCPTTFINFFSLWSTAVPTIQSLTGDQRHDLARVICEREPISSNPHPSTGRIAADLRAVAIEISQRRSFQDRYASDLQAVLDAGGGSVSSRRESARAQFVPPPEYEPSTPNGTSVPPHQMLDKPLPSEPTSTYLQPPSSPTPSVRSARSGHSRTPSGSGTRSPSILTESDPVIDLIRETLYASIGDQLALSPSIRSHLKMDPARAYYSAVSLAVLDVSTNAVLPNGSVRGVLGQEITFDECPNLLKPAMRQLDAISRRVQEIAEEDDQKAMDLLAQGKDDELAARVTRMDRLRRMLETGAGVEESAAEEGGNSGRLSPDGTTITLANKINALALGLTGLPAFRERQNQVFEILAGASR